MENHDLGVANVQNYFKYNAQALGQRPFEQFLPRFRTEHEDQKSTQAIPALEYVEDSKQEEEKESADYRL